MVGMRLDPRGKLRWFRAIPPVGRTPTEVPTSNEKDLPWSVWFREEDVTFKISSYAEDAANPKRLSAEELRTADWLRTPPDAYDSLAAWRGTWPGSNEELFVQAAAYRGLPVYFEILHPSAAPGAADSLPVGQLQPGQTLVLCIVFCLFVGAVLLAWRNLRLGRGDRRGALRLAVFVFIAGLLVWGFHASHAGALGEIGIFMIGWGQVLQWAASIWLYYIALEPLLRRIWPEALISWTRLLDGRFRDPRIGRDLLLGVLGGVLISMLGKLNLVVPGWFGLSSGLETPGPVWLLSLLGPAALTGVLLAVPMAAVWWGLPPFLLLGFLRIMLRSERLAACVALVVVTGVLCLIGEGNPYLSWLFIGLSMALQLCVMLRSGVLATVTYYLTAILLALPITPDPAAFYFGSGLLVMGLVIALALYGFFTSLAGRSLFA
jgi:hypothetical protein